MHSDRPAADSDQVDEELSAHERALAELREARILVERTIERGAPISRKDHEPEA